ncbi:M48 family metalloprotease [Pikeienuella piscinae]|uniref:M48 family metalloprotease n=1 Tax=Pikeienuella piscinae TaxID=2748098 RepID=A0A7L5BSN6_9RHOB|nr:M48 family metalloprotease [Pikeienuella piscinae]QIE54560.1 M48 family metalloprotease [Pikeienuella piscinae]
MKRLFRKAAALGVAIAVAVTGTASAANLIRDAEIEATLGKLSAPIFRAAGLDPNSIELLILQDSSLNAFVFGGRNMVFHTGLLERLDRPEKLMGVMAHETGHIIGGHLTRRALNMQAMQGPLAVGLLLAALAGAAAGDAQVGVAGALGAESALRRSLLAYSRGEESSADQAGATYMEKAGIDPAYVLDVLKIFRGQEVFQAGNVDPYAISHPLSSERLALLEDRAARSRAKGESASADLVYWHARMRAKLSAFTDSPERTLAALDSAADPESEINLLRRAVALHRLPNPSGSLKAVEQLIALRPNDPYYWELKGQILFESGRGADAVEPYRRAVSLAPNEALIRGGLGRALLALNDPARDAEALATLEGAALAGASEPSMLRDLALAYARAGDDGKAALATAERYALTGQPRDALRHAHRALDQLPVGSPGWLRADDIRAVAERALSDK